jgi:hypothetical protein
VPAVVAFKYAQTGATIPINSSTSSSVQAALASKQGPRTDSIAQVCEQWQAVSSKAHPSAASAISWHGKAQVGITSRISEIEKHGGTTNSGIVVLLGAVVFVEGALELADTEIVAEMIELDELNEAPGVVIGERDEAELAVGKFHDDVVQFETQSTTVSVQVVVTVEYA